VTRTKREKSWIADVRELVGTRRIMIPAAVAWIHDDAGRLLVVQLHGRDLWGLPGGGIEPDETPEQAVVREVAEETGLEVRIDELGGAFGGPRLHHTYVNGDEGAYVMIAYRCSIVGGTPEPDGDEVTALRWITADDLETLSVPGWGQLVMGAALGVGEI
jgi:8-oxo-dGTP pyrophosphatase MutT (NUDIX family)